MKLSKTLAIAIALTVAQPVLATQKNEVAYLMDTLLTQESKEKFRLSFASSYAKVYTKYLKEKSVTIVDQDKFAGMMPTSLTDRWLQPLENDVEQCFNDLPPEVIKLGSDYIRWGILKQQEATPQQSETSQPDLLTDAGLEQWKRSIEEAVEILERPGLTEVIAISLCVVHSVAHDKVQKEEQVQPGTDVSFLADILETSGVARFPNRVLKDDILSELRETAGVSAN